MKMLFPGNRHEASLSRLCSAVCAVVLACALTAGAVGTAGCQAEAGEGGSQSAQSQSQGQQQEQESASSAESESASSAEEPADENAAVDIAVFDDQGNPTFAAMLKLDGKTLVRELEAAGYAWDENGEAWYLVDEDSRKPGYDDPVFFAEAAGGTLGPQETAALDAGAVNRAASYVFAVHGYDIPADALLGLTAEVPVSQPLGADDIVFALVADSADSASPVGQSDRRFLIALVKDGQGGLLGITFSDASLAAGLFQRLIGVDAGDSVSKAWEYCRSVF